mmetsp:Transcript_4302/g.4814  ORF Transcript_4302/g.4814 Transcript_4302/m.4814 type:complete len:471 (-) Transcript_4302:296-1708(-)
MESKKSLDKSLSEIAKAMICPIHPQRAIKFFCQEDSTFCCQECSDEKDESFTVIRVKTSTQALNMITTRADQRFCEDHNQEAVFFCHTEAKVVCPACISDKCQLVKHHYDSVDLMHQNYIDRIAKIKSFAKSFSLGTLKIDQWNELLKENEKADTARINARFDSVIARINEIRAEVLAEARVRRKVHFLEKSYGFNLANFEINIDVNQKKLDLIKTCEESRLFWSACSDFDTTEAKFSPEIKDKSSLLGSFFSPKPFNIGTNDLGYVTDVPVNVIPAVLKWPPSSEHRTYSSDLYNVINELKIDLCDEDVNDLANILSEAWPRVRLARKLDLGGLREKRIDRTILPLILLRTPQKCHDILYFDFSYNECGNEGAKLFAKILENNYTLLSVNLSGNRIAFDGVHALADALGRNRTLQTLKLNDNKIEETGARRILRAMESHPIFRELSLERNLLPQSEKLKSIEPGVILRF